jgi:predicted acylesterase/phospholipase RssA
MSIPLRPTPVTDDVALVLGGGGARGAYQAGLLRAIARHYPQLQLPILVGVSAGAINTVHLASHRGTFAESTEQLVRHWLAMSPEQVYRVDARSLLTGVIRSGYGLMSGDPSERERGARDGRHGAAARLPRTHTRTGRDRGHFRGSGTIWSAGRFRPRRSVRRAIPPDNP